MARGAQESIEKNRTRAARKKLTQIAIIMTIQSVILDDYDEVRDFRLRYLNAMRSGTRIIICRCFQAGRITEPGTSSSNSIKKNWKKSQADDLKSVRTIGEASDAAPPKINGTMKQPHEPTLNDPRRGGVFI